MKSSKDYKGSPAQQTRLCSRVKAFLTLMLWYLLPTRFAFLLSTALSATRSVCLAVGPEGTATPNEHMISDSNQITTPRREVSHGMSMAVSLTLGSVVSPRTRGFFKNDDYVTATFAPTGALERSFPKEQKELV